MSTHIITVSRVGLSVCPSCGSHVRIAVDLLETTCPFCGASLVDAKASRRSALAALGRSAAVATVLLGAGGLVGPGCKTTGTERSGGADTSSGGEADKQDVVVRPAPEPPDQPEYGTVPTPMPEPAYGAPPQPQPQPQPQPDRLD